MFGDALSRMRDSLQDWLDDLASPHSSNESKTRALINIEQLLAMFASKTTDKSKEQMDAFVALQHTFECNVCLRIIAWIGLSVPQLEAMTKSSTDDGHVADGSREAEMVVLTSQLSTSLSIVQGAALTHPSSKAFLARKYTLEILLDLLVVARHLPMPEGGPSKARSRSSHELCSTHPKGQQPLTSLVLDTLLCILVDSPPSLRIFETAGGLQAVVRILKRAATPREVRMKCLEFLYFYLLDENAGPVSSECTSVAGLPLKSTPSSLPATPTVATRDKVCAVAPPERTLRTVSSERILPNERTASLLGDQVFVEPVFTPPSRPVSVYGSSTYTFSSGSGLSLSGAFSDSGSSSSRSVSGGSMSSFSSTGSNISSVTSASNASCRGALPDRKLGNSRKPLSPRTPRSLRPSQPRQLQMLRRELEFVPVSPHRPGTVASGEPQPTPKKAQVSQLGLGRASSLQVPAVITEKPHQQKDPLRTGSEPVPAGRYYGAPLAEKLSRSLPHMLREGRSTRTTEEKKEILGTMLGNVDALVESVKKAGIWGLG
ncbi:hypothetical protein FISHEDRAFT_70615 [Fistulina hepatica ATCC 64428]|uniref:CDC14-domain-containing protein n=1 Tax=Fistulina hepatica ATCC 64428 TaxID=1128425 RepID=A0A0D7AIE5_9AGAR|nr:hypothetical protein FISHEDRAFT_70615 [Fistulina hepatica ATCC 64428]